MATTITAEQSALINMLEEIAGVLQKAQINLRKCPKARLTEGYIKTRLKSIDEYWESFRQAHNSLVRCTPREQRGQITYFLNEEFYKYEEVYLSIQADLSDLLSLLDKQKVQEHSLSANTSQSQLGQGQQSLAKLPRIQLPTFTGRYEDWPAYEDLFIALVHSNSSLGEVQKFHYLKTSVSGEAETLIRHIQVTGDNYSQAWGKLKERFGNKRTLVTNLLKRLFTQRKVQTQSAIQIKSLLDTTTECLNSLNNLKIQTDSWDPFIIFLVSQKLDPESFKEWEKAIYKDTADIMPTWEELKRFLEGQFRTLEQINPMLIKDKIQPSKSYHNTLDTCEYEEEIFQSAHANISPRQRQILCTYCKDGHYIFQCKEFTKQPVEGRREFVQKNQLCFNCLIPGHNVYRCRQRTTCRICHRRHHSLLHEDKKTQVNVEDNYTKAVVLKDEQPEQITTLFTQRKQPGNQVMLATAMVKIRAKDGVIHTLRALLDQGSEASFITASVVELLGLPKFPVNGAVSGVGEGQQIPIKHKVDITVIPRFNDDEAEDNTVKVKAFILKSVSTRLPSRQVTVNWSELQKYNLADPTCNTPGKIDILLGADVFGDVIEEGLLKMSDGLVAQKTTLGWVLSGKGTDTTNSIDHNVIALHITSVVAEDNDILRKFWEIESETYKRRKMWTKEEEECELIYKTTTKRDDTGRYEVYLPLKQSVEETVEYCGETKELAIKRLKQLERRFETNTILKKEYMKVIHEYISMGHMKMANEDVTQAIYLPHHPVVRNDKDTTKVRVVFDASAKGSNGHSLNEAMLVGPVLQTDLRSLITKWRMNKFCVVGDLIKMYRMVNMTELHTNLQRIVWRDDPTEEIKSYNLTTVTFGTAAAPYLAVRTLHQLANDEEQKHEAAASVIKSSYYVDDLMMSNEDIENTKILCDDLNTVLESGGFKMQKWSSNSEEVIQHLSKNEDNTRDKIDIKLDKIIKILGLKWDRKDDTFKITVKLPEIRLPVTKRSVLSDIARLFDPFGWLAPVVITAKVMIQKLWLCSLGWDDELPQNLINDWVEYRDDLINLETVEVNRWLRISSRVKEVQLHGFADASSKAYAAVTYLKVVDEDDQIHVTIIASRTKVAPLKQISIPKLELCAAALLAELLHDVADLLNIAKENTYAWSDSMVVLAWLQSQPSRWRTFVANRVAEITRVLDNDKWRHVQSADNPADIATRGVKASNLASQDLWWTGPEWLRNEESKFTRQNIPETKIELKEVFHNKIQESEEEVIWERFSNITRMKRVLAYARRMLKTTEKKETYLNYNEMETILNACIKYYQTLVYEEEINDMNKKEGSEVKKRSSLITLSPFLDKNGLIRVGGRLENACLPYSFKHPILIPSNQHITKLIINEAHLKTMHGGIQQTINYVRTRYWVINLKAAVKKCIHNCKTCTIHKAKTRNQLMGQLPAVRINPHRAFLNSGVDYAGPILIRTSKGRGHQAAKGYICLFICMSTRAIHLEAVTDLTTEAFIAAYRRFVARRGRCLHLWSDNGTNFVGAAKELKTLLWKSNDIGEVLANEGTTWHFIPPRMPNCGGLWEAGVRSVKRHLARVNKDTKLTYEEMSTLLAQIEACLNSRPLYRIDDATEMALTPAHFLIGEPIVGVPDINYEHKKVTLLTRWQLIQRLTQDFWRKWQSEYLHSLQQRYKWQKPIRSPAIGDLVVIKEEDLPPTKWLLGKIKLLHPGADNLTRVVTIQCKGNHELKRPLSKIILMPTEATETSQSISHDGRNII